MPLGKCRFLVTSDVTQREHQCTARAVELTPTNLAVCHEHYEEFVKRPPPIKNRRVRQAEVKRALAREPWLKFLLERVVDDDERVMESDLPLAVKIHVLDLLACIHAEIGDYITARAQKSLWAREARFGLYVALRHHLDKYMDHPDFKEEWL